MLKRVFLAAVLLALVAAASEARPAVATTAGPRVGFSLDPDQLVVGGHLQVGEIAPSLTFDPSLELGFGDDVTVIAMNFDMHYHVELQESDWRPYFGAGIGVNFTDSDRRAPQRDQTDTEVGGSVVLGASVPIRSGNRFFGEMRLGLGGGIAELKLIAGWNFRI
jgi:hypothetical protein